MIKKLNSMYKDVLYVSKITNTRNKKIRILLTVVLGNLGAILTANIYSK